MKVEKEESEVWLARSIEEEERKAIKGLQKYFTKESLFQRNFASSCQGNVDKYLKNFLHWDIPDAEKVVMSWYSLVQDSGAHQ